ncbi:MAG: hypothetical protein AAF465_08230 [Pseudomonadota bacterium]
MESYRHLHLWLLIPLAVAIIGFTPSYWLKLDVVPFRQHLHGISATVWFVFLVVQPYLITRARREQHRWYGIIGLFVAGGVVFSALGTLPYNFVGDLPDVAKYGLTFIDVVVVIGFTFSVLMAVRKLPNMHDHARWMIASVFWALVPAFARIIWHTLAFFNDGVLPIPVFVGLLLAAVINALILIIIMVKERRAHPAFLLAALGNLVYFTPPITHKLSSWRAIADALFIV